MKRKAFSLFMVLAMIVGLFSGLTMTASATDNLIVARANSGVTVSATYLKYATTAYSIAAGDSRWFVLSNA